MELNRNNIYFQWVRKLGSSPCDYYENVKMDVSLHIIETAKSLDTLPILHIFLVTHTSIWIRIISVSLSRDEV